LEKRLQVFYNIHRCNTDLVTKQHVELVICLTSKLTFFTAPSGSGNHPLTYNEDATKFWVIKQSVYSKLVLIFQQIFSGVSMLQMNAVESSDSMIDYLFRAVCEANPTSYDDYQRLKSALCILSSLPSSRMLVCSFFFLSFFFISIICSLCRSQLRQFPI
jgi:hypothetical protein